MTKSQTAQFSSYNRLVTFLSAYAATFTGLTKMRHGFHRGPFSAGLSAPSVTGASLVACAFAKVLFSKSIKRELVRGLCPIHSSYLFLNRWDCKVAKEDFAYK